MENGTIFRNTYLANYWADFHYYLVCRVMYKEDIKYVNLIEISLVVTEIWEVENGELMAPVNNSLVHHMAFLAANTRPCVLIYIHGIRQTVSLEIWNWKRHGLIEGLIAWLICSEEIVYCGTLIHELLASNQNFSIHMCIPPLWTHEINITWVVKCHW